MTLKKGMALYKTALTDIWALNRIFTNGINDRNIPCRNKSIHILSDLGKCSGAVYADKPIQQSKQ